MIAVKVDGIFLLSLKHPKRRAAEYMVEGGEGEIIPVNPTPYLLSPALLAAIAIIALILAAPLTVK